MNSSDLTNRLSEKQKQRLVEAKNQEDLDQLFTPDDVSLSDDHLEGVSGGCFRPTTEDESNPPVYVECPTCGQYSTSGENCKWCGNFIPYNTDSEHRGNNVDTLI